MSTPVLPVVIRGPGIIVHNSYAYYFGQDGVKVSLARATEKTMDDFYGCIDETSRGGPTVDLTFTPTGMIRSLAKPFPYGPTNLVASWVSGQSIMNGTVYIQTKAGQRITYQRAGILKSPTLYLNPRRQIFGPMTLRAINRIDVQPTNSAALKAITTTAFSDTTFDETKIVKDIYTATLGARSAPFNAMGARDGFEVEAVYETEDADDFNVGIADTFLNSVQWRCRFAPNNLAEADLDSLANWQDTNAVLAGQSPAKLGEDLVLDSSFFTATLHNVGFVKAENGYGAKLDRNGQVECFAKMKFTTGAPNPLITLTIN